MKKLIITTLAVIGMAAYVNAQGTFTIDSGANFGDGATTASTTGGLVFMNGVLASTDFNMQILWGSTSSTVVNVLNMDPTPLNSPANTAWIASEGTGSGDGSAYGGGAIFDPNGLSYHILTIPGGNPIWLEIEAWTGSATSWATVGGSDLKNANVAASEFTITLAAASSPIQPDIHAMPSINLVAVPEPCTLALAGLGGLSLLLIRRRK